MRKLKMYLAVIISFTCVSTYFYETYTIRNTISVSSNMALVIKHGLIYENGLLKHYQEYSDSKESNEDQMVEILNSLKGSLLSYDAKVTNLKEDNDDLVLEVNEAFFTVDKATNLKIAEALNYLRKLFFPSSTIRIYINNAELTYVPQTDMSVRSVESAYPNLFSGDAVSGNPVVLIEQNVLYTTYSNNSYSAYDLSEYLIDSIIFDNFTSSSNFIENIEVTNKIANIYLNDMLLTEENKVDEEILSDYLIMLFMNNDFECINIYLNDEPYYYRGRDKQSLKMSDIVYNLR